jgi:predicted ATPase
MVNAVDFLVDSGFIIPSGDQHRVEQTTALSADRIEVPRSIRKMIEYNLDRLKPEEQAVLERASVAGEEFSAAAVAAAIQQELAQVEKCCTKLSLQEQFIRAGEPIRWPDGTVAAGFRFRHSLYQEVLYGRIPAGLRLQLHRRIAEREEAGHGDHAPKVAAELAHHYLYGNDKDKAVKYLQLAAEQALGRGCGG